jgi:hypothetical protein
MKKGMILKENSKTCSLQSPHPRTHPKNKNKNKNKNIYKKNKSNFKNPN